MASDQLSVEICSLGCLCNLYGVCCQYYSEDIRGDGGRFSSVSRRGKEFGKDAFEEHHFLEYKASYEFQSLRKKA